MYRVQLKDAESNSQESPYLKPEVEAASSALAVHRAAP
jgi:hypothetical protein